MSARRPALREVVWATLMAVACCASAHAQGPSSPAPTSTTRETEATSPPEAGARRDDGSATSTNDATPADGDTTSAPSLTPEQRFRRGRSVFEYRDCKGAIDVLADLAVPGQLADEKDQLEVHRMLGICYAQQDDRRAAAREFSSLLSIDPDHQLDPFEVPPPVIELFEAQKQTMKARLDELRRERERARAELGDGDGGILLERTTTLREVPLAAAFLPFGLAQAANGQTAKAFAFGSVQGVALLANVVGYWGAVTVQAGAGNARTANEALLESIFWYSHVGALGVLAAAYGVGVVDAWWNHEDQSVLNDRQTRRPLTAGELKKLRRVERADAPTEPSTSSSTAASSATAPGAATTTAPADDVPSTTPLPPPRG